MKKTFERKSTFTFMLKSLRLSQDGAMTLNIIKFSMKTKCCREQNIEFDLNSSAILPLEKAQT